MNISENSSTHDFKLKLERVEGVFLTNESLDKSEYYPVKTIEVRGMINGNICTITHMHDATPHFKSKAIPDELVYSF